MVIQFCDRKTIHENCLRMAQKVDKDGRKNHTNDWQRSRILRKYFLFNTLFTCFTLQQSPHSQALPCLCGNMDSLKCIVIPETEEQPNEISNIFVKHVLSFSVSKLKLTVLFMCDHHNVKIFLISYILPYPSLLYGTWRTTTDPRAVSEGKCRYCTVKRVSFHLEFIT